LLKLVCIRIYNLLSGNECVESFRGGFESSESDYKVTIKRALIFIHYLLSMLLTWLMNKTTILKRPQDTLIDNYKCLIGYTHIE